MVIVDVNQIMGTTTASVWYVEWVSSDSTITHSLTHTHQELEDIRKNVAMKKVFQEIQVNEDNILHWNGLVVPVSSGLVHTH